MGFHKFITQNGQYAFPEGDGTGGGTFSEDVFTVSEPVSNTFLLSAVPDDPGGIFFFLNGIQYVLNNEWSIVGALITWNPNVSFPLVAGDKVNAFYTV